MHAPKWKSQYRHPDAGLQVGAPRLFDYQRRALRDDSLWLIILRYGGPLTAPDLIKLHARLARMAACNMPSEHIPELKKWVAELLRKSASGGDVGLDRVVDLIRKHYAVQRHEVAIFALSDDGRFLKFVTPEKLQAVGQIPLTSTNSLAARTAHGARQAARDYQPLLRGAACLRFRSGAADRGAARRTHPENHERAAHA